MRTLRSLLGLFIVGVIIYCAWTLLPVYITNYQLEDAMDSAARFGAVDSRKTEREIRESVLHEAQALQVDITPEQIQVQRTANDVLVWGDYTVHVNLPLYPVDLHFQPMSKSKKRAM
jgi:hypothetical protein